MDGLLHQSVPALDISAVAGRITNTVGRRHARAVSVGDTATAARYDVSVDTIYYASLLLMVVDGAGRTRTRNEVLAALDTAEELICDLRDWVEGHV